MTELKHQHYMQVALNAALKGVGRTAPNPPVGAVIVKSDQIVGVGFHPQAGQPHAEIFALEQAGDNARGADIYVTLEPCSHYGKTPPCADALIAAGIKAVYIGVVDPNPQVAGRGVKKLQNAGVVVQTGVLESECLQLIKPFRKHIVTGLPFTIYKAAVTLDGNTATKSGDSRWVSGEASLLTVHQLRDRVDAIMVGIGTVLNDDPLLNTRLPDGDGRDPMRIVVDSQLRIDPRCRLLTQESTAQSMIATISTDTKKISILRDMGVDVVVLPSVSGRVSLPALWTYLGQQNIQRLLLEGGATLATEALHHELIDQLMVFIAPKLLGGSSLFRLFSGTGCDKMGDAIQLENLDYQQVGEDLLITGDIASCLPD
ncbi:diaminohydroxyphosphoribosylaminopyrimidine deaminase [Desulfuromusa kysingii]|uniref:Riboflavin biosynthesis protein RibD n=1 Tax=Desulfuromusa kysingii TaxID=37625 RepID=A0A1H4D3N7_9BACT|nr:bifunctional diaminohydroxyphosphoribosylaminopyrimidine deaminase/5-amino-6-(5-phosphoribosylamino)uracil reductase RibD [Desulfuromusa kysingii]SEA67146.1 diaminohydroxyphosphoribosylaminopyrimidine deaminase [Desulfuromusa kysingii]